MTRLLMTLQAAAFICCVAGIGFHLHLIIQAKREGFLSAVLPMNVGFIIINILLGSLQALLFLKNWRSLCMKDKELPRIGTELSEGEKLYYQFMDNFQDALEQCVKTGQESRLMIGMGERNVVITISEAGSTNEQFDQVIKEIAKGNFEVRDQGGKLLGEGPNVKPTELEPT